MVGHLRDKAGRATAPRLDAGALGGGQWWLRLSLGQRVREERTESWPQHVGGQLCWGLGGQGNRPCPRERAVSGLGNAAHLLALPLAGGARRSQARG